MIWFPGWLVWTLADGSAGLSCLVFRFHHPVLQILPPSDLSFSLNGWVFAIKILSEKMYTIIVEKTALTFWKDYMTTNKMCELWKHPKYHLNWFNYIKYVRYFYTRWRSISFLFSRYGLQCRIPEWAGSDELEVIIYPA